MQANAMTEEFEYIELFGKPVLFTNARVDKATVPEGWYRYNIRGSDYDLGTFCTLEREVGVNHAGTILSPEEIHFMPGKDYMPIDESQNFLGETMTLSEFCVRHRLPHAEAMQEVSPVGRVSFASGEQIEYADPVEYLRAIQEELPYHATNGFHFETLTSNPTVRKAVDDVLYDFYGEDNPHQLADYRTDLELNMTMEGI